MCGITGISYRQPQPHADAIVRTMTNAIRHRGPDSSGIWHDESCTNWLGFRRLAIRDLDPRADQPMRSASGNLQIVFNGEIYNTSEIKNRCCSHHAFRTTGDTEVLLEAFERQGPALISDLNGMFAAAIYQQTEETLTLFRDRMGKKPLYLYQGDDFLAFGSELRTLRQWPLDPNPEAMPYYFHFGYFPAPHTFYKQVTQVLPGEIVTLRRGEIIDRNRYHSFVNIPWGQTANGESQLGELISDAVSIRTLSDVPVGAFLSGGIDSSLVAAHLSQDRERDIPTFTVAFAQKQFNEAKHAAAIANHYQIPNLRFSVNENSLADLVDDYIDTYEQPYHDSSGLPTMRLCEEVKRFVTVVLSGDGGDEFFAGYQRYSWFQQALTAQRLPSFARKCLQLLIPRLDRKRGVRMARLLACQDAAGLYASILQTWNASPLSAILQDVEDPEAKPINLVRNIFEKTPGDPISQAACFDAEYYIPDDLQVKLDRASMRVSLEVRCPLLDFRVATAGARLVTRIKWAQGKKTVLRNQLAKHLPRSYFERPKQGFGVPLATWLSGPLRDSLHDALHSQCLRETGWLGTKSVASLYQRFVSGETQLAGSLWMLYVLSRNLERGAEQTPKQELQLEAA